MTLPLDPRDFSGSVRSALQDAPMRANLRRAMDSFLGNRARAEAATPDWQALRDRGHAIKREAIERLDEHLDRFEAAVRARGGHVHRAEDADHACAVILRIAQKAGVRRVIKGKSMATEEIELNHAFAHAGIESVETDLGEYILQAAGEKPFHIVGPALHKNRADIAAVFRERLGYTGGDRPEQMTAFARELLRRRFLEAEMGVSGGNFAVAETGSIVLVENEGNIRMTTTLPPLHVALVGIEKLVPRWSDLAVMLRLLPRAGTGQKVTVYVSAITGPRLRPGDEGAREMHVVLLDNGRRRMHADPVLREALYCIRCGACLNTCPVYQRIGGHSYGSIYSGPIGSLVTPGLAGTVAGGHLAFASSLCGACKDACPVKINIPDLLLHVRAQKQQSADTSPAADHPWKDRGERFSIRLWARIVRDRKSYERAARFARRAQKALGISQPIRHAPLPPLSEWTKSRDFPPLAPQSFREWWLERHPAGGGAGAPEDSLAGSERRLDASAQAPHDEARVSHEQTAALAFDTPAGYAAPGATLPLAGAPTATASGDSDALLDRFRDQFTALGGRLLATADPAELLRFLTSGLPAGALIALSDGHLLRELALADGLARRGFPTTQPDAADYAGQLARAAAGVTGVAAAMAATGSLMLAGAAERNRQASLLPPVYIALFRPADLVPDWEEALDRASAQQPFPQAVTWITGPSRTADIELTLCLGVHGPGEIRAVCWRG
jgi:L-lactate dehydrogenase complex protein LldF